MGFPLGDWIDSHADLPCNLGVSGMARTLRTPRACLRSRERADAESVRGRLATLCGVAPSRLFLTHGATEANALSLLFLRQRMSRGPGAPRARLRLPEYPPIVDVARIAGFQTVSDEAPADLLVLSSPNNPTGRRLGRRELARRSQGCRRMLVDETFREFTDAPSVQSFRLPGTWSTGTFTKAYGADSARVGFVIVPEVDREPFELFHALLLDGVAAASLSIAHCLLRHRSRILAEARRIFEQNRELLVSALPESAGIAAPLWFDRGPNGLNGDGLARAAVRAGILVCSGRYFGDPTGVRICLTQRSFPRSFRAYLKVRQRFVRG